MPDLLGDVQNLEDVLEDKRHGTIDVDLVDFQSVEFLFEEGVAKCRWNNMCSGLFWA